MRRLFVLYFVLLTISFASAQSVESYVTKGIEYHDASDYEEAIAAYKQALAIDKKSGLANYELSHTYFSIGDYKNALKYSSKALKDKSLPGTSATIIKGSALDMLGKTEKSVKFMEEAMKDLPPHYLLHYNVALNYHKLGNYGDASRHCEQAIFNNTNHSSSHYMLSISETLRNHPTQSMLAGYFFLLLEPNSSRSENITSMLEQRLIPQAERGPEPRQINLSLDVSSEFMALDMLAGMLNITRKEGQEEMTDDQIFVDNTQKLFSMIGEQKTKNEESLNSRFYVPFFSKMAESEHMETFCHFIRQGNHEPSAIWIDGNEERVQSFYKWLEEE